MNETEKHIVAWLRMMERDSMLSGPNKAICAGIKCAFAAAAEAIERGEHRQHSPAKDDGK